MSVEIMGYKGRMGLSKNDKQDFDDLTIITKYLSEDLIGTFLSQWYMHLSSGMPDTGMFYCPYIPLMTTSIVDENFNKINS